MSTETLKLRYPALGIAKDVLRHAISAALTVWPWVLGSVAFWLFLTSPQGRALAQGLSKDPPNADMATFAIRIAIVVVLIAVTLAQVAAISARHHPFPTRDTPPSLTFRLELALRGLSVLIVSVANEFLYANATNTEFPPEFGLVIGGGVLLVLIAFVTSKKSESWCIKILRLAHEHRYGLAFLVLLAAFIPLMISSNVAMEAPERLAHLGPLLVCMLGLAGVTTLFGTILVVIPLCLRAQWFGAIAVAAMLAWAFSRPMAVDKENDLIKHERQTYIRTVDNDPTCGSKPDTLVGALRSHAGAAPLFTASTDDANEVVLLSAEGGGIRAAYWTAITLAQLDVATADKFGRRVAVLSGVSGGSFGIAAWLAARDLPNKTPQERLELLHRFLSSDFLSPLLAGLLALDIPRLALGPAWYRTSRDQVFELAIYNRWYELTKSDFFARPFRSDLCIRGIGNAPAVYFNATDAITGAHVALANVSDALDVQRTSVANLSVAQAVHISARFPYLSPGADIGVTPSTFFSRNEQPAWQDGNALPNVTPESTNEDYSVRLSMLVDGGYYDNTGLSVTEAALVHVQSWREAERLAPDAAKRAFAATRYSVVHIANDPSGACVPRWAGKWQSESAAARKVLTAEKHVLRCLSELATLEESVRSEQFRWFTTPIRSMLAVRVAHSAAQKERIRKYADSQTVQYHEISLGKQLTEALEGPTRSLDVDPLYEVYSAEMMVKQKARRLQDAVASGRVTRAEADQFQSELTRWLEKVRSRSKTVECSEAKDGSGLPLGWTLNSTDRRLMSCLAAAAASRSELTRLLPPLEPAAMRVAGGAGRR